jgi:uncharacterized membrane protein
MVSRSKNQRKTMKLLSVTVVSTASLSLALGLALAKDVDVSKLPPPLVKQDVTYAKDVKTVLEKSCVKCHGAEKAKGKLRFDSLSAALKGGESGKVIQPGNSAKSRLVHAIARLDPDEAMPPADKGDPLTKEQVGLIRAWIDQGAK